MNKNIQLQNEINDEKIIRPVSYYKNYRVAPEGTAPTQFNNSTQTILFSLPSESVVNFSKITLCFRRTGTALNATPANTTDDRFFTRTDFCSFFNKIEVFSGANNARLMEVVNADYYSKLYTPLNNEPSKNSLDCGFLYPATDNLDKTLVNSSNAARVETNSVVAPFSTLESVLNTVAIGQNPRVAANLGIRNYNIRLGDVYGGIFNLNKSVYISKNMYIRLTLNTVNKIVGVITAADGIPSANTVADTSVINVANWALNIYTESNPIIIESVKNESKNGVTYLVPDIVSNQYAMSGSTGNRSVQFRIINGTGNKAARLYRVYTVLASNGGTNYSKCLYPTSNYSSDNTYLNSKYNYLSMYVNSNTILQLDIQARDHVQHMINQHKVHSLTDKNYVDDWGAFATIFDTTMKNDEVNDNDNNLVGLDFGPSNECNIQFSFNIASVADNIIAGNGNFINYSFAEVIRPMLFKDGYVYTSGF